MHAKVRSMAFDNTCTFDLSFHLHSYRVSFRQFPDIHRRSENSEQRGGEREGNFAMVVSRHLMPFEIQPVNMGIHKGGYV